MPEPWASRWEVISAIGGGGQGLTKKVRSRDDERVAVLKVLKQQRDHDRRGRMHREAEALRTLAHPGIPRLLDSNTSEFAGTTPLYIVVELVDGPTLEEKVKLGALALPEAVALTVRLVEIVAYCHERSFAHRDIKPDNVLLRGGASTDPVLIDFGLSFNIDEDPFFNTATEQQVGNRFLSLPELTTPGNGKRDPRSDLASCCGILFFLLSGRQPMTLRDEAMRAPHERQDFLPVLQELTEVQRTLLSLLMGRGFMYALNQRYQEAAELKSDLERILDPPTYASGAKGVRAAIEKGQLLNREATLSRTSRDDALGEILKTFVGPICEAVSRHAESRKDDGVPIVEFAVDPQGWRGIAARVHEKRGANVFHFKCKAQGTRGFEVFLRTQRSEYEETGTIKFVLVAEWADQKLRQTQYVLNPGGRWTEVGPPERETNGAEVVSAALALLDDEGLWSVPEMRDR